MTHTSARRTARRRSDSKAGPLGVEDWIGAANDLLISENVRGVQVSALCMKLKVTKGSFYWHFASRQDLLRALLASWRRRMTLNIATRVGRAATGAVGTIRTLLALPRKTFSAAGAAIEMSIRDWGRREKLAHDALQEVDRIRLSSFEQSFRALGLSARDAKLRAYIAYAVMMGDSVLKETLREEITTEEFVDLAVQLLTPATPGARSGPPD